MKFITDMSKGILGEPDSYELWNEILSQDEMYSACQSAKNILVVAGGHGTEVDVLVDLHGQDITKKITFNDQFSCFTNLIKLKYSDINTVVGDFMNLDVKNKFDIVVGNPPYQGELHLKFLERSLDLATSVVFIHPAQYLIDERGQNKTYNRILNKIDGHCSHVILDNPNSNFEDINIRGNLATIYIDQSTQFNTIKVEHRNINTVAQLSSVRDINNFGNYDVYLSFKRKVFDYIAKNGSMKDHWERDAVNQYKIPLSDLANYCFFGEKYKRGGIRGVRTDVFENSNGFVSFKTKSLAEAALRYLRSPIAILALHIYKKNMHTLAAMESVPFFDTIADFDHPEKSLKLTKKEVKFAEDVLNNVEKYFFF